MERFATVQERNYLESIEEEIFINKLREAHYKERNTIYRSPRHENYEQMVIPPSNIKFTSSDVESQKVHDRLINQTPSYTDREPSVLSGQKVPHLNNRTALDNERKLSSPYPKYQNNKRVFIPQSKKKIALTAKLPFKAALDK